MNFIPDVRYDFQTPNIVTLAVKVVTSPPPPTPLRFHWIRLQRTTGQGKVGLLPAFSLVFLPLTKYHLSLLNLHIVSPV